MVNADCCLGVLWSWPHERERVISDDTTLTRSMRFRVVPPAGRRGAEVTDPERFAKASKDEAMARNRAERRFEERVVAVVLLAGALVFVLAWFSPAGRAFWL